MTSNPVTGIIIKGDVFLILIILLHENKKGLPYAFSLNSWGHLVLEKRLSSLVPYKGSAASSRANMQISQSRLNRMTYFYINQIKSSDTSDT